MNIVVIEDGDYIDVSHRINHTTKTTNINILVGVDTSIERIYSMLGGLEIQLLVINTDKPIPFLTYIRSRLRSNAKESNKITQEVTMVRMDSN